MPQKQKLRTKVKVETLREYLEGRSAKTKWPKKLECQRKPSVCGHVIMKWMG